MRDKITIRILTIIFFSFLISSCDPAKKTSDTAAELEEEVDTLTINHTAEHELENIPDCVFNRDTVTDAFLNNIPEFNNYTWNNESKEARIVLPNNDSLYIHVGGCQHYGVTATLTRIDNQEAFTNHSYWISEAEWIASRVKGFEVSLLHDVDQKKNYEEESDESGLFIDFHENDYTLIVDRKEGHTHITLNHYFH